MTQWEGWAGNGEDTDFNVSVRPVCKVDTWISESRTLRGGPD